MTRGESSAALLVARVKQCAIGQYDTHRLEHTVTIGVHAATHTAGVVHHDTADHSRLEAGWVRGEILAIRAQDLIDTLSHNTRLQGDGLGILADGVLLPLLAAHHQQTVADGLSTERGACSTESDMFALAVRAVDDGLYILLIGRVKHFLWDKTVETCIGSPRQSFDVSFHCS